MIKRLLSLKGFVIAVGLLGASHAAHAVDHEGRVIWWNKVPLSTPISGVVAKVNVRQGDVVKAGDILMELDLSVAQADVDFAKANFAYQERLLKEAQRELERNQALYDQTVLAEHELEVAKIAYDKADAEHAQVKAALRLAEQRLRESVVTAPFDGIVVMRNVEPGQTLVHTQQAPSLFEVADPKTLQAQFFISAVRAKRLKPGDAAAVQVGKNRFSGKVVSVAMEATDGRFEVRVSFPTKGRVVRVGEKATVSTP